ncbi:MAG: LolA family protein [Planctomycetota bacterium]|jgi:outer membrane lipoprotein-sorting protein
MRPAENVEKFIKRVRFKASTQMHERILNDALEAQEQSRKTKSAEIGPNIWRIIMKSRITKLAAAAAIIVIAVFAINQFTGTTVVYGVTEVLELCKKAGTIHIQGRSFYPEFPEQNKAQQAVGFEVWLDIKNGRSRVKSAGRMTKDGQTTFTYFENVIDGHYRMRVDHSKKSVTYYKIDKTDQQKVIALDFDFQLKQMFGDPDQIEAYALTGSEQIDGLEYDIWQAEIQPDPDSQTWLRIKIWLSPVTGEIVRVVTRQSRDRVDWFRTYEIDKIERNVSLSDGLFETEPPVGYLAQNTKETPKEKRLAKSSWYGKEAAIAVYQGFTLEDGSVIIVFSSTNRKSDGVWTPGDELADVSQIEVFESLDPGGPLPELPIVVSALERKSLWRGKTIYVGRHLTYTQKDDRLYEWAIYVPTQEVQRSRIGYESFEAILRFNPPSLEANWNYKVGVFSGRHVDAKNFNTLLLKYMADTSDDVLIPEDLTYENVLQLARKIRNSLGE